MTVYFVIVSGAKPSRKKPHPFLNIRNPMMKELTTRDLKEPLTLLLLQRQEDGEGGWKDVWKKGPHLWGSIWPILEKQRATVNDQGPMASSQGYSHLLPSARYRVVIRAGLALPYPLVFLWHLRHQTKRLRALSSPLLIQYNKFLSLIMVEDGNA